MKHNIICIKVNSGTDTEFIDQFHDDIENKTSGYVCFSNVHMLIEAYDNPEFAHIVNEADYTLPDGFPIAKSFQLLYGIKQERIAGMDFLPNFLEHCNKRRYKVSFIGSTEDVLERTRQKITAELPGILLTHLISPPFGSPWNNEDYVRRLNESGTQVVFVALGCPKQEKWMYSQRGSIDGMMFGIGGALPTYVGEVRRAPVWMQKIGLEWFYRLWIEPKRMFRRYFYTNSKFLFLMINVYFKRRESC